MPLRNVMKNAGGIGTFSCKVKGGKKEYQTLKQSLCREDLV